MKKQLFIAEIKTQSPFGFKSEKPFAELMELAIKHGDMIAVHDTALYGGDYETISFVRKHTDKPILAKGFHSTAESIELAFKHGATHVLVVDWCPDAKFFSKPNGIIYEFSSLDLYKQNLYRMDLFSSVMVNSRNLRTGNCNPEATIENYRKVNNKAFLCQASNIRDIMQVNSDADAFIVGSQLQRFIASIKK